MAWQLTAFLNGKKLLDKFQSGFRKCHSTETALLFWFYLKINEKGFSASVLKWFSSYLSDRSFCVFVNSILSEMSPLSCGVPQGSVLGPILFLLYISPLGEIIHHFKSVLSLLC